MSHAAAIKLAMQDQATLAKNFKQYLIMCQACLRVEGGNFQQSL